MDWKILPVLISICYHVFSVPFSSSTGDSEKESLSNSFGKSPIDSKLCLTPGCIVAAADLIQSMDHTADPCVDFYQFACGGFVANTVIPDHQIYMGPHSNDKIYERLRKIFEAEPSATEPKVYKQVRNHYISCMDKESIEKNSVNNLKEIVDKIGGWPVLQGEKWDGENFKWHELSIKASDEGFGSNHLIDIYIDVDAKDSLKRILSISQPSLSLSREYLINGFDDKYVQAYYMYMVHTAVYLGAEEDVAKKDMKEALEVEMKLAEMSMPSAEMRNMTALYNPMTLGEANKLYPEFPIISYISSLGLSVDENEVVHVSHPKYLSDFRSYITTVPAKTQANYIIWRIVQFAMPYLNEEALKIELTYDKVLMGITHEAPRWEKCVRSTAGFNGYMINPESLANAVGGMYIKQNSNIDPNNVVDQMVENIKTELKMMIDELDWIDPKTKDRAHKKSDQMTAHVNFPDELLNDKLVDEFFEGLDLQKENYLENILCLRKFFLEYNIQEFRKPIDQKSWKTHGGITVVNAWYYPSKNSIQIPAGILDGVFFNADWPLYMNYGAIGLVIGHEITHGFDDRGSQYDEVGNLVDWWESESKKRYLEKVQCIIDQYGNYTVEVECETLNLNGVNTQGENIADNGAMKEVYRAYARIESKSGPEPILPGLGLNQRQLLWLSSARSWCAVQRPASLRQRILTMWHSPSQFRVNGPLSNMPEFAKDWGCPAGTKMNPHTKCSVW